MCRRLTFDNSRHLSDKRWPGLIAHEGLHEVNPFRGPLAKLIALHPGCTALNEYYFCEQRAFFKSCVVFALFSSSLQFHNKLFSVLGRIRFCEVVAHVSFILSHSFENIPGNPGR